MPDGNGTDDGVNIGSAKGPSFDVTGLRSNTRYCFGVSAVDDAGNASPVGTAACASTLANSEARWRFRIACRYQEYLLESFIDLDEDFVAVVSVLGEGEDYDGSHLTYALTGPYDNETQVLDGTINWTDDGLSIGRQDTFQADLSLNDTGDIGTSKSGTAAGCDAVIRFDRRDAAAMAGPSSGSAGPGPGGCSGERDRRLDRHVHQETAERRRRKPVSMKSRTWCGSAAVWKISRCEFVKYAWPARWGIRGMVVGNHWYCEHLGGYAA